ncbi:HEAT repeat domain-containing protein, partial [Candidatus Omnitrophota bacterium]
YREGEGAIDPRIIEIARDKVLKKVRPEPFVVDVDIEVKKIGKVKVEIYQNQASKLNEYWMYCPEIFNEAYPGERDDDWRAVQNQVYRKASFEFMKWLHERGDISDKLLFSTSEVNTTVAVPCVVEDKYKYDPLFQDVFVHHYNHTIVRDGLPEYKDYLFKEKNLNISKEYECVVKNGKIDLLQLTGMVSDIITGCSTAHTKILRDDYFRDFAHKVVEDDLFGNSEGSDIERWQGPEVKQVIKKYMQIIDARTYTELFIMLDNDIRLRTYFIRDALEAKRIQKRRFITELFKGTFGPVHITLEELEAKGVLFEDMPFFSFVRRVVQYKCSDVLVDLLYDDKKRAQIKESGAVIFIGGRRFGDYYDDQRKRVKRLYKIDKDMRYHVFFIENHNVYTSWLLQQGTDFGGMLSWKGREAGPTSPTNAQQNGAPIFGTLDGVLHERLRPIVRAVVDSIVNLNSVIQAMRIIKGTGYIVGYYKEEGAEDKDSKPDRESLIMQLAAACDDYYGRKPGDKRDRLYSVRPSGDYGILAYNALKMGMTQGDIKVQAKGLIRAWAKYIEDWEPIRRTRPEPEDEAAPQEDQRGFAIEMVDDEADQQPEAVSAFNSTWLKAASFAIALLGGLAVATVIQAAPIAPEVVQNASETVQNGMNFETLVGYTKSIADYFTGLPFWWQFAIWVAVPWILPLLLAMFKNAIHANMLTKRFGLSARDRRSINRGSLFKFSFDDAGNLQGLSIIGFIIFVFNVITSRHEAYVMKWGYIGSAVILVVNTFAFLIAAFKNNLGKDYIIPKISERIKEWQKNDPQRLKTISIDTVLKRLSDQEGESRKLARQILELAGATNDQLFRGYMRALATTISSRESGYMFMIGEAVVALGELRDARSFDPLLERLKDGRSYARTETVTALVNIDGARAFIVLRDFLNDAKNDVRRSVVEGYASITGEETFTAKQLDKDSVIEQMLFVLTDEDGRCRCAAAKTLKALGATDEQLESAYLQAFEQESPYIRIEAAEALAVILKDRPAPDKQRAIQVLLGGLADPHKGVYLVAAKALEILQVSPEQFKRGSATAIEHLLKMLTDVDSDVRENVRQALKTLGATHDQLVTANIAALEASLPEDSWEAYRIHAEAIVALAKIDPIQTYDLAVDRLEDSQHEKVRSAAATALAIINDPRAIPHVQALLERTWERKEVFTGNAYYDGKYGEPYSFIEYNPEYPVIARALESLGGKKAVKKEAAGDDDSTPQGPSSAFLGLLIMLFTGIFAWTAATQAASVVSTSPEAADIVIEVVRADLVKRLLVAGIVLTAIGLLVGLFFVGWRIFFPVRWFKRKATNSIDTYDLGLRNRAIEKLRQLGALDDETLIAKLLLDLELPAYWVDRNIAITELIKVAKRDPAKIMVALEQSLRETPETISEPAFGNPRSLETRPNFAFQNKEEALTRIREAVSAGTDDNPTPQGPSSAFLGLLIILFIGVFAWAATTLASPDMLATPEVTSAVMGGLFVSGSRSQMIKASFPHGISPVIESVRKVTFIKALASANMAGVTAKEKRMIDRLTAELIHAYGLAAVHSWMNSSVNTKIIKKFADYAATFYTAVAYNLLPLAMLSVAAEGARDEAETMEIGQGYGLKFLLNRTAVPIDLDTANDPLEVTGGAALASYLGNVCIGSHDLSMVLRGEQISGLCFPDSVYMYKIVARKGSNVDIDLPLKTNLRRIAARIHGKAVTRVNKTDLAKLRVALLIRGRHRDLINELFRIIGFSLEDVPVAYRGYFEYDGKTIRLSKENEAILEKQVLKKTTGLLALENSAGGKVILCCDGDLMPINGIMERHLDGILGAGGTAEALISSRIPNGTVDFSGRLISHTRTRESREDALQVSDLGARRLTQEEYADVRSFGIDPKRKFTIGDLAGNNLNLTIAAAPKGQGPERRNNWQPQLRGLRVSPDATTIDVYVLVSAPHRRYVIKITYNTYVQTRLKELSKARTMGIAQVHLELAKLYGELKCYHQAQVAFTRARESAQPLLGLEPDFINEVDAWQMYYEAIQEILAATQPDVSKAARLLRKAKRIRGVMPEAHQFLTLIETAGDTVIPYKTATLPVALYDVLEKQGRNRQRALKKLYGIIPFTREFAMLRLLLERIACTPVRSDGYSRAVMSKIISAALVNRWHAGSIRRYIIYLTYRRDTSSSFKQVAEESLLELEARRNPPKAPPWGTSAGWGFIATSTATPTIGPIEISIIVASALFIFLFATPQGRRGAYSLWLAPTITKFLEGRTVFGRQYRLLKILSLIVPILIIIFTQREALPIQDGMSLSLLVLGAIDGKKLTAAKERLIPVENREVARLLKKGFAEVFSSARGRTRLLDIGAGDGEITAGATRGFDEVIAIEQSIISAGKLQRRGIANLRVVVGDFLEDLPSPTKRPFDAIIMSHVLLFIPFRMRDGFLQKRVLPLIKEGTGRLAIVLNSNEEAPRNQVQMRRILMQRHDFVPRGQQTTVEHRIRTWGYAVRIERIRIVHTTDSRDEMIHLVAALLPAQDRGTGKFHYITDYVDNVLKLPEGQRYQFNIDQHILWVSKPGSKDVPPEPATGKKPRPTGKVHRKPKVFRKRKDGGVSSAIGLLLAIGIPTAILALTAASVSSVQEIISPEFFFALGMVGLPGDIQADLEKIKDDILLAGPTPAEESEWSMILGRFLSEFSTVVNTLHPDDAYAIRQAIKVLKGGEGIILPGVAYYALIYHVISTLQDALHRIDDIESIAQELPGLVQSTIAEISQRPSQPAELAKRWDRYLGWFELDFQRAWREMRHGPGPADEFVAEEHQDGQPEYPLAVFPGLHVALSVLQHNNTAKVTQEAIAHDAEDAVRALYVGLKRDYKTHLLWQRGLGEAQTACSAVDVLEASRIQFAHTQEQQLVFFNLIRFNAHYFPAPLLLEIFNDVRSFEQQVADSDVRKIITDLYFGVGNLLRDYYMIVFMFIGWTEAEKQTHELNYYLEAAIAQRRMRFEEVDEIGHALAGIDIEICGPMRDIIVKFHSNPNFFSRPAPDTDDGNPDGSTDFYLESSIFGAVHQLSNFGVIKALRAAIARRLNQIRAPALIKRALASVGRGRSEKRLPLTVDREIIPQPIDVPRFALRSRPTYYVLLLGLAAVVISIVLALLLSSSPTQTIATPEFMLGLGVVWSPIPSELAGKLRHIALMLPETTGMSVREITSHSGIIRRFIASGIRLQERKIARLEERATELKRQMVHNAAPAGIIASNIKNLTSELEATLLTFSKLQKARKGLAQMIEGYLAQCRSVGLIQRILAIPGANIVLTRVQTCDVVAAVNNANPPTVLGLREKLLQTAFINHAVRIRYLVTLLNENVITGTGKVMSIGQINHADNTRLLYLLILFATYYFSGPCSIGTFPAVKFELEYILRNEENAQRFFQWLTTTRGQGAHNEFRVTLSETLRKQGLFPQRTLPWRSAEWFVGFELPGVQEVFLEHSRSRKARGDTGSHWGMGVAFSALKVNGIQDSMDILLWMGVVVATVGSLLWYVGRGRLRLRTESLEQRVFSLQRLVSTAVSRLSIESTFFSTRMSRVSSAPTVFSTPRSRTSSSPTLFSTRISRKSIEVIFSHVLATVVSIAFIRVLMDLSSSPKALNWLWKSSISTATFEAGIVVLSLGVFLFIVKGIIDQNSNSVKQKFVPTPDFLSIASKKSELRAKISELRICGLWSVVSGLTAFIGLAVGIVTALNLDINTINLDLPLALGAVWGVNKGSDNLVQLARELAPRISSQIHQYRANFRQFYGKETSFAEIIAIVDYDDAGDISSVYTSPRYVREEDGHVIHLPHHKFAERHNLREKGYGAFYLIFNGSDETIRPTEFLAVANLKKPSPEQRKEYSRSVRLAVLIFKELGYSREEIDRISCSSSMLAAAEEEALLAKRGNNRISMIDVAELLYVSALKKPWPAAAFGAVLVVMGVALIVLGSIYAGSVAILSGIMFTFHEKISTFIHERIEWWRYEVPPVVQILTPIAIVTALLLINPFIVSPVASAAFKVLAAIGIGLVAGPLVVIIIDMLSNDIIENFWIPYFALGSMTIALKAFKKFNDPFLTHQGVLNWAHAISFVVLMAYCAFLIGLFIRKVAENWEIPGPVRFFKMVVGEYRIRRLEAEIIRGDLADRPDIIEARLSKIYLTVGQKHDAEGRLYDAGMNEVRRTDVELLLRYFRSDQRGYQGIWLSRKAAAVIVRLPLFLRKHTPLRHVLLAGIIVGIFATGYGLSIVLQAHPASMSVDMASSTKLVSQESVSIAGMGLVLSPRIRAPDTRAYSEQFTAVTLHFKSYLKCKVISGLLRRAVSKVFTYTSSVAGGEVKSAATALMLYTVVPTLALVLAMGEVGIPTPDVYVGSSGLSGVGIKTTTALGAIAAAETRTANQLILQVQCRREGARREPDGRIISGTFKEIERQLPDWRQRWGTDLIYLLGIYPQSDLSYRFNRGEKDDPENHLFYVRDESGRVVSVIRDIWEGNPMRIASMFSIADFMRVGADLGTMQDFQSLVATIRSLGMKAVIDIVFNHTAIDHPWVTERTEYYAYRELEKWEQELSDAELLERNNDYFIVYSKSLGRKVLVEHGKEGPNAVPWRDCAQLHVRDHMQGDVNGSIALFDEFTRILEFWAQHVDGLRCDMAHLVSLVFWHSVIPAARKVNPNLILISETYWNQDAHLRAGFDFVYDEHTMKAFLSQDAPTVRDRLSNLATSGEYQAKSMRYSGNHDMGADWTQLHYFGYPATVLSTTSPGLTLVHIDQLRGLPYLENQQIVYHEPPIQELAALHEQLLAVARKSIFSYGTVTVLHTDDPFSTIIGRTLIYGDQRSLVTVNYSGGRGAAQFRLSEEFLKRSIVSPTPVLTDNVGTGSGFRPPKGRRNWSFTFGGRVVVKDALNGKVYIRKYKELRENGIYVELGPFQSHIFILSNNVLSGYFFIVHDFLRTALRRWLHQHSLLTILGVAGIIIAVTAGSDLAFLPCFCAGMVSGNEAGKQGNNADRLAHFRDLFADPHPLTGIGDLSEMIGPCNMMPEFRTPGRDDVRHWLASLWAFALGGAAGTIDTISDAREAVIMLGRTILRAEPFWETRDAEKMKLQKRIQALECVERMLQEIDNANLHLEDSVLEALLEKLNPQLLTVAKILGFEKGDSSSGSAPTLRMGVGSSQDWRDAFNSLRRFGQWIISLVTKSAVALGNTDVFVHLEQDTQLAEAVADYCGGKSTVECRTKPFHNKEIQVGIANPEQQITGKHCTIIRALDSEHISPDDTVELLLMIQLLRDFCAESIRVIIPSEMIEVDGLLETIMPIVPIYTAPLRFFNPAEVEKLARNIKSRLYDRKHLIVAARRLQQKRMHDEQRTYPDVDVILFTPEHKELKEKVALRLQSEQITHVAVREIEIETFANDYPRIEQMPAGLKGKRVLLIHSTTTNKGLNELLIILPALQRARVADIVYLAPDFSYSRQHKTYDAPRLGAGVRSANSAQIILESILRYCKRLYAVNIHFFKTPDEKYFEGIEELRIYNLNAFEILAIFMNEHIRHDICIPPLCNPVLFPGDLGATNFVEPVAEKLGWDFAAIDKKRLSPNKCIYVLPDAGTAAFEDLRDKIAGRDVVMLDDTVSTGSTLVEFCEVMKNTFGAKRVFVGFITVKSTPERLQEFEAMRSKSGEKLIDGIFTTDTCDSPVQSENIASVSDLIVEFLHASRESNHTDSGWTPERIITEQLDASDKTMWSFLRDNHEAREIMRRRLELFLERVELPRLIREKVQGLVADEAVTLTEYQIERGEIIIFGDALWYSLLDRPRDFDIIFLVPGSAEYRIAVSLDEPGLLGLPPVGLAIRGLKDFQADPAIAKNLTLIMQESGVVLSGQRLVQEALVDVVEFDVVDWAESLAQQALHEVGMGEVSDARKSFKRCLDASTYLYRLAEKYSPVIGEKYDAQGFFAEFLQGKSLAQFYLDFYCGNIHDFPWNQPQADIHAYHFKDGLSNFTQKLRTVIERQGDPEYRGPRTGLSGFALFGLAMPDWVIVLAIIIPAVLLVLRFSSFARYILARILLWLYWVLRSPIDPLRLEKRLQVLQDICVLDSERVISLYRATLTDTELYHAFDLRLALQKFDSRFMLEPSILAADKDLDVLVDELAAFAIEEEMKTAFQKDNPTVLRDDVPQEQLLPQMVRSFLADHSELQPYISVDFALTMLAAFPIDARQPYNVLRHYLRLAWLAHKHGIRLGYDHQELEVYIKLAYLHYLVRKGFFAQGDSVAGALVKLKRKAGGRFASTEEFELLLVSCLLHLHKVDPIDIAEKKRQKGSSARKRLENFTKPLYLLHTLDKFSDYSRPALRNGYFMPPDYSIAIYFKRLRINNRIIERQLEVIDALYDDEDVRDMLSDSEAYIRLHNAVMLAAGASAARERCIPYCRGSLLTAATTHISRNGIFPDGFYDGNVRSLTTMKAIRLDPAIMSAWNLKIYQRDPTDSEYEYYLLQHGQHSFALARTNTQRSVLELEGLLDIRDRDEHERFNRCLEALREIFQRYSVLNMFQGRSIWRKSPAMENALISQYSDLFQPEEPEVFRPNLKKRQKVIKIAAQEAKAAEEAGEMLRVILIADTTGVGKTTWALSFIRQLLSLFGLFITIEEINPTTRKKEKKQVAIPYPLDRFFKNEAVPQTGETEPRFGDIWPDENGRYDYDSPYAYWWAGIEECLTELIINGTTEKMPETEFQYGDGTRGPPVHAVLKRGKVIIVEGIYAHHPNMLRIIRRIQEKIEQQHLEDQGTPLDRAAFRLMMIQLTCRDDDVRLVRRLIRDTAKLDAGGRKKSALDVFMRWFDPDPNVGILCIEREHVIPAREHQALLQELFGDNAPKIIRINSQISGEIRKRKDELLPILVHADEEIDALTAEERAAIPQLPQIRAAIARLRRKADSSGTMEDNILQLRYWNPVSRLSGDMRRAAAAGFLVDAGDGIPEITGVDAITAGGIPGPVLIVATFVLAVILTHFLWPLIRGVFPTERNRKLGKLSPRRVLYRWNELERFDINILLRDMVAARYRANERVTFVESQTPLFVKAHQEDLSAALYSLINYFREKILRREQADRTNSQPQRERHIEVSLSDRDSDSVQITLLATDVFLARCLRAGVLVPSELRQGTPEYVIAEATKIIRRHAGTIAITSKFGVGENYNETVTIFTITLPQARRRGLTLRGIALAIAIISALILFVYFASSRFPVFEATIGVGSLALSGSKTPRLHQAVSVIPSSILGALILFVGLLFASPAFAHYGKPKLLQQYESMVLHESQHDSTRVVEPDSFGIDSEYTEAEYQPQLYQGVVEEQGVIGALTGRFYYPVLFRRFTDGTVELIECQGGKILDVTSSRTESEWSDIPLFYDAFIVRIDGVLRETRITADEFLQLPLGRIQGIDIYEESGYDLNYASLQAAVDIVSAMDLVTFEEDSVPALPWVEFSQGVIDTAEVQERENSIPGPVEAPRRGHTSHTDMLADGQFKTIVEVENGSESTLVSALRGLTVPLVLIAVGIVGLVQLWRRRSDDDSAVRLVIPFLLLAAGAVAGGLIPGVEVGVTEQPIESLPMIFGLAAAARTGKGEFGPLPEERRSAQEILTECRAFSQLLSAGGSISYTPALIKACETLSRNYYQLKEGRAIGALRDPQDIFMFAAALLFTMEYEEAQELLESYKAVAKEYKEYVDAEPLIKFQLCALLVNCYARTDNVLAAVRTLEENPLGKPLGEVIEIVLDDMLSLARSAFENKRYFEAFDLLFAGDALEAYTTKTVTRAPSQQASPMPQTRFSDRLQRVAQVLDHFYGPGTALLLLAASIAFVISITGLSLPDGMYAPALATTIGAEVGGRRVSSVSFANWLAKWIEKILIWSRRVKKDKVILTGNVNQVHKIQKGQCVKEPKRGLTEAAFGLRMPWDTDADVEDKVRLRQNIFQDAIEAVLARVTGPQLRKQLIALRDITVQAIADQETSAEPLFEAAAEKRIQQLRDEE